MTTYEITVNETHEIHEVKNHREAIEWMQLVAHTFAPALLTFTVLKITKTAIGLNDLEDWAEPART